MSTNCALISPFSQRIWSCMEQIALLGLNDTLPTCCKSPEWAQTLSGWATLFTTSHKCKPHEIMFAKDLVWEKMMLRKHEITPPLKSHHCNTFCIYTQLHMYCFVFGGRYRIFNSSEPAVRCSDTLERSAITFHLPVVSSHWKCFVTMQE